MVGVTSMKSIICAILLSACLTGIVKADGRMFEVRVPVYKTITIEVVSETEAEICVKIDDNPVVYCEAKDKE